ncbi:MAG: hypothetical protein ACPGWR_13175 [Ardenticatenaceae bacterium]
MAILLENYPLSSLKGHLEFLVTLDVSVSAEEAKRKADFWLHDQVSMQISAEWPTLVVGRKTVWHVPAHFSLPSYGPLGVVGTVVVDGLTGEIVGPEACRAAIVQYLNQKVKPTLPFYKRQKQVLSEQFVAKGFPSVPRLVLKDDVLVEEAK